MDLEKYGFMPLSSPGTYPGPFVLSPDPIGPCSSRPGVSPVELGVLRQQIETLIAEQGQDAAVAVFYITAKDVAKATEYLRSIGQVGDEFAPDAEAVLKELQINAADQPFADQLVDEMHQILIDMAAEFGI